MLVGAIKRRPIVRRGDAEIVPQDSGCDDASDSKL